MATSPFTSVSLRHFDAGMICAFGAELVTYAVDGEDRQAYAVAVDDLTTDLAALGGRVPVLWGAPDDPYQHFVLPCYAITRNDLQVAYDRAPFYGYQRAPAVGASAVVLPTGERGWSGYAERWNAHPFNFTYDIKGYARLRGDAHAMLLHLLRWCRPPWFGLRVTDSAGDVRRYDAGDFNISDTSDLQDLAHRSVGWTCSLTVRGEVDLSADTLATPMRALALETYNYRP